MHMGCSAGTWSLQTGKITKQKQHHYGYRERWGWIWQGKSRGAESQRSPKLKTKPTTWYCKNQKNIQTRKLLVQTNKHLYFSTVLRFLCTSKRSEEERLQEWRLGDAHCLVTKNFWGSGSSSWAPKCCPQHDHPVHKLNEQRRRRTKLLKSLSRYHKLLTWEGALEYDGINTTKQELFER